MRVAVTGANGFVGRAVLEALRDASMDCAPITRRPCGLPDERRIGSISGDTNWKDALAGCDAVIHLAARVHFMREQSAEATALYREVNVDGTLSLARQALDLGIKRLVFVSTAKILGEFSTQGRPFKPEDPAAPHGPYASSKAEAEAGLRAISAGSDAEIAIVRPPLVYGPGVGGNFRSMMRLIQLGLPLPFGAIDNRRSLVGADNLASLLVACAAHPDAAGQTFHATDGEDISTTELLKRIAYCMGRADRLIAIPRPILSALLRWSGAAALDHRLCADLQLDGSSTGKVLDWRPRVELGEGLRRTVAAFIAQSG